MTVVNQGEVLVYKFFTNIPPPFLTQVRHGPYTSGLRHTTSGIEQPMESHWCLCAASYMHRTLLSPSSSSLTIFISFARTVEKQPQPAEPLQSSKSKMNSV